MPHVRATHLTVELFYQNVYCHDWIQYIDELREKEIEGETNVGNRDDFPQKILTIKLIIIKILLLHLKLVSWRWSIWKGVTWSRNSKVFFLLNINTHPKVRDPESRIFKVDNCWGHINVHFCNLNLEVNLD
jgi:hypothetical protein